MANYTTASIEAQRLYMVEAQLRRRGIRDARVLEAMSSIPRELFIPESRREWAYCDEPVSIDYGQTISQPYMIALMAEVLQLTGTEKVLEVGTGCGYHAAVLASLAYRVVSIEIVRELAAEARRNLEQTGFAEKVQVVVGDGSLGYPPFAPYDAISVAAAAPDVPEHLAEQLKDGGRLVIPVGTLDEQELLVITKSHGGTTSRVAARCRFVPLRGGEGWKFN